MFDSFLHPKEFDIIQCPPPNFIDKKRQKLNDFEKKTCRDLFITNFQDVYLMQSLSCYLQWLLYSSSFVKHETSKKMIPILITQEKQKFQKKLDYKARGISGEVFASEFLDHFPIVVKYGIKFESFSDILHEYMIAIKGTNKLRLLCSNFGYTMALYLNPNCDSRKVNNRGREIEIKICKTSRLVMENIPGPTYSRFLLNIIKLPFSEKYMNLFLKIFVQLILALEIGQETVFFTHYDLHSSNILIRETQTPIENIVYQVLNTIYTFDSVRYVPTIIDFGHASIKTPEGYIGKAFHNSFAVEGMYPFYIPGADIFKIIMSIWLGLFNKKTGDNYTLIQFDPNSMGHVLSNFFSFILEGFFKVQTWNPEKSLYVNPVDFQRPDVTRLKCVYNSPLHLLDFFEKKRQVILNMCRIPNYPWTTKPKQEFVTTFIPTDTAQIGSCFESLYCSKINTKMENVFASTWNLTEGNFDNTPAEIILRFLGKPIPRLELQYLDNLIDYLGNLQDWENFVIYMNRVMSFLRAGKRLPDKVGNFYLDNILILQYFYRAYICIKGFFSYLHNIHKIAVLI